MKWEGREESENVEDQRGSGRKPGLIIAGGGGAILLLVLGLILGVDPQKLLNQANGPAGGPGNGQQQADRNADPVEEKEAHFSKIVFRDTELVWTDLFEKMGRTYEKPVLVLFTDEVQSACGFAESAVGPFYCPGDSKVYIDLGFYRDMQQKLNAPGEFARAYVIAHEVGHHVQRLLGYSARAERGGKPSNEMSVRLELQADFLAGVWAHRAQEKFNYLEKGDVDSALNAAFEIGDDRLQRKSRGYVVPEKFTHGSSKQRVRWFRAGFDTGDVNKAAELFERRYDDL
jgi:uncharacterized protein